MNTSDPRKYRRNESIESGEERVFSSNTNNSKRTTTNNQWTDRKDIIIKLNNGRELVRRKGQGSTNEGGKKRGLLDTYA